MIFSDFGYFSTAHLLTIPVSKEKSMVCIMRSYGEIVASPFEIIHTQLDFNDLIQKTKQLDGEIRVTQALG